jgi:photosystem II stability/assembly factor-like uncharacterized protein
MHRRTSAIATAFVLAIAVSCGSAAQSQLTNSNAAVRDAALLTTKEGWALTDVGLQRTSDAGLSWTTVTPPDVPAAAIASVTFTDPDHGWLATNQGKIVSRTTDGGATWLTSPGPAVPEGTVALSFIDPSTGWLLASWGNANFSYGALYATSDAGVTWQARQVPSGGRLKFTNATTGWLASRDRLFRSLDGGRSWTEIAFDPTASARHPDAVAAVAVPAFFGPKGLLAVTYGGGTKTSEALYASDNLGATWRLLAEIDLGDEVGAYVAIPWAAVDADTWLVAAPSGRQVVAGRGAAYARNTAATSKPGIQQLSSRGADLVWAVQNVTECSGPKGTACTEFSKLLATTDQGRSWRTLSP